MKFAVIGKDVSNSLSPRLHTLIYRSIKLDYSYKYINITLNDVDKIVNKLRGGELNGVSITTPFKRNFIDYLDQIDPLASRIGSINCIRSNQGFLTGYNTDYYGFSRLIERNKINLSDKRILIVGAGGVSRSICSYLVDNKCKFSVINRTEDKALNMIDDIGSQSSARVITSPMVENKFNVIINCVLPKVNIVNMLQKKQYRMTMHDCYIDINYFPSKENQNNITSKLVLNGIDLLIYQAIKANEIWLQKDLEEKIDIHKLQKHLTKEQC